MSDNHKYMTLFTDASHCPETGAAGWGAWIKGGYLEKSILFGGQFKHIVGNSTDAEVAGIANAIRKIVNRDCLEGVEYLQIQCDSVSALQIILTYVDQVEHRPHKKSKVDLKPLVKHDLDLNSWVQREAVKCINEDRIKAGIELSVRHIQGHRSGSGRNWVNGRCDRVARKHMKGRRRKLDLFLDKEE